MDCMPEGSCGLPLHHNNPREDIAKSWERREPRPFINVPTEAMRAYCFDLHGEYLSDEEILKCCREIR